MIGELVMFIHCRWLLVAGFGMGLLFGPVGLAAHAAPCRCATTTVQELVTPVDPPFTLPYERPDSPVGSGLGIDW